MDSRWLDPEAAARYLSVRADALGRLVRAGRIPAPSYVLGEKSPRWDRLALDAAFDGGAASTNTQQAVAAIAQAIEQEGRSRRQARLEGRNRTRISVRDIPPQADRSATR